MKEIKGILSLLFILGIIIIPIIIVIFKDYGNEKTTICVVNEKWVKRVNEDDNDLYLVNCGEEVYEISDLLFKGKFNSANIYSNLKIGKKYKIKTTGYRFGLLSWYQNINEYEEIK